jgi:hypothetical protein
MPSRTSPVFHEFRRRYHARLLETIFYADETGVPSNADKDSVASVRFAQGILERLRSRAEGERLIDKIGRLAGQRTGRKFEEATAAFIEGSLLSLEKIRRRRLSVSTSTGSDMAQYEQFSHLDVLEQAVKRDPNLAFLLGSDNIIWPDIAIACNTEAGDSVVARGPLADGGRPL